MLESFKLPNARVCSLLFTVCSLSFVFVRFVHFVRFSGRLFKCMDQVLFGDRGTQAYLFKQITRVAAGLQFVELLAIWGACRAGKDTWVATLCGKHGLMGESGDAELQGWSCTGPSHYFCASAQRQPRGSEGHSANTAAMGDMRLIVLPDIPDEALIIDKAKLDGTNPVQARAGHSRPGDNQQTYFKNLWLMHGNQCPRLAAPDPAQADRIAVVHFKGQCGPVDDPEHDLWLGSAVPTEFRIPEDPQIKDDAAAGLFCAEFFEHTKHEHALMREQRKVEPRPLCVQIAAKELIRGAGRSMSSVAAQWLSDALEPREVFCETWRHEVQLLLLKHLREQEFETTVQALNDVVTGLGWCVKQRGLQRAPTGTPTTMRVLNSNVLDGFTTRGGNTCIAKVTELGTLRYGLRPAYRQALVDTMRARAGRALPDPVSEEEILAATLGSIAVPQRFLDIGLG